jgi:hypothetical protein
MAYKKYIEKNGKIYGPYVYHSKRVDGKVISEYHGIKKDEKKYRKKLIITIGTILFLFLVFWIIFFSYQFSGRVILNIEENYQEGDLIQGKLNIELKQGELLPYNSKIILENAGNVYEFNLNELIETNPVEGDYFIEGIDLTSQGEGYGTIGQKEILPTIFFKLSIIQEEVPTEEPTEEISAPIEETQPTEITEEPTEEITAPTEEVTIEEPTEEITAPITGNIVEGVFSSVSNFFTSILTGKIIEEEIQGDVSKNNPTEYNIPENSNVEIIEGSVKTEEKELSENVLNLQIENNKAIISTEYSEIIEGFGEEYLGEEMTTFSIDLNNLNISLEEEDTIIKIIYQDVEIYSIKHTISPGQLTEKPTEETSENITNETQPIINETNITIEEENITEENITIDLTFEKMNLTNKEKQILKDEIQLVIVQTKVNEYKDKFEVIFTLGDYTMEHYYDLNLDEIMLKEQIERDRIIWLKDLANKFSEEISLTEAREDLNENYAVM